MKVREPAASDWFKMRKLMACALETILWIGTPLLVLTAITAPDSRLWSVAGLGALGFVLAMGLGQHVFVRVLANQWRRRADRLGFDGEGRRIYLAARLCAIGSAVAAVLEEGAKFLLLLWILPATPHPLRAATALGVGHGGVEAVLFGLIIGAVGTLDIVIPDKMADLTLVGVRRSRPSDHLTGAAERLAILAV